MSAIIRKNKYIDKAIKVLKKDGLRISLDEIAEKMGITKKTLYNNFSSKEELLKECIQSISEDFRETIKELDNPDKTAIENLRNGFSRINHFYTILSPVFFYDLMRLNPNQATSEHMIGSDFFKQKMEANLKQGINEGVYRNDLEVEYISHYTSYSIFGFYINCLINNNHYISKTYFEDMAEYNLRAIVSEEGKKIL